MLKAKYCAKYFAKLKKFLQVHVMLILLNIATQPEQSP